MFNICGLLLNLIYLVSGLDRTPTLQWSSSHCVGHRANVHEIQNEHEQHHWRSCWLKNICLNLYSEKFDYFSKPDRFMFLNKSDLKVDPFLHIRAFDGSWEPNMVNYLQRFPRNVHWVNKTTALMKIDSIDSSKFPSRPAGILYIPFNYGHFLYEIMYPIFQLLDTFELYERNSDLLILNTYEEDGERYNQLSSDRSFFQKDLLTLLFDNPVKYVDELIKKYKELKFRYVCFENVVIGTGQLFLNKRGTIKFHEAVVRRKTRREVKKRHTQRKSRKRQRVQNRHEKFKIVVFDRQFGRRQVENMFSIIAGLRQEQYNFDIQVVLFNETHIPTLDEQINILGDADLFISPGGAISCAVILLRKYASAMIFNVWDPRYNISRNLDNHNYAFFDHVWISYIDVSIEDYENTTDKPSCINSDGFGHNPYGPGPMAPCNIWIKNVNRVIDQIVAVYNNQLSIEG